MPEYGYFQRKPVFWHILRTVDLYYGEFLVFLDDVKYYYALYSQESPESPSPNRKIISKDEKDTSNFNLSFVE